MRRAIAAVLVVGIAVVGLLTGLGDHAHAGTAAQHPSGARLVDSIGASAGVAWAIDRHGFVWLTMDSGRTWRVSLRTHVAERVAGKPFEQRSPHVVAVVNQMQFVDKRHGWISAELDGDPFKPPVDTHPWAIERTVDGGRTWHVSWLPGCGCDPGFLSFYDARHGYVLAADRLGRGNPRLFWTDDGGARWKLVSRPPHNGSITFLDRRNGLLSTYPGATGGGPGLGAQKRWPAVIYRTTDGGKTWSKYRVPPPSFGFWPDPVSSFGRRLVVANGIYGKHPKVYASVDGGARWTASVPTLPANARTTDFAVGSPETWAFLTPGRLFVTHDGGQQWDSIVPHGLPRPNDIYPLVLSSPRVGWTLMTRFKELYRTTDGGRHWTPVVLRHSAR